MAQLSSKVGGRASGGTGEKLWVSALPFPPGRHLSSCSPTSASRESEPLIPVSVGPLGSFQLAEAQLGWGGTSVRLHHVASQATPC